jgi:hypothetical protein
MIDFAQDYIDLIGSRINVMNIPSISNISAARVPTPNRPNQRLNIGRSEAISSVVILEMSGTEEPVGNSPRESGTIIPMRSSVAI